MKITKKDWLEFLCFLIFTPIISALLFFVIFGVLFDETRLWAMILFFPALFLSFLHMKFTEYVTNIK